MCWLLVGSGLAFLALLGFHSPLKPRGHQPFLSGSSQGTTRSLLEQALPQGGHVVSFMMTNFELQLGAPLKMSALCTTPHSIMPGNILMLQMRKEVQRG